MGRFFSLPIRDSFKESRNPAMCDSVYGANGPVFNAQTCKLQVLIRLKLSKKSADVSSNNWLCTRFAEPGFKHIDTGPFISWVFLAIAMKSCNWV